MRVTAFKAARLLLDFLRAGNRPDLILLDIRMPDMDGFEALARIKELETELEMEEIPVIFLTANDNEDAETKGLAMGALDFIKKPFVVELLEQKPQRLYVIVVKCDIRILKVNPITHLAGQLVPKIFVFQHLGATGVIVIVHTDSLANVFLGDAKSFFIS